MKELKPDWPEASQRLRHWWAGGRTDRVAALVTAPRRGASARSRSRRVPEIYTDPETVFGNLDAGLATTFFGGEAIPAHWVYLGPVPLGGYLGCELHFEPDTVWQSRRFDTWDGCGEIGFDPENRWYRLLGELARASLERAAGRYLVSGQGFGCVWDVIANLWGSESTLMAMAERPATARAVARRLVDISRTLYDELDAIVSPFQDGSFDWLCLWAPGRLWTLQCDLCCMISPAMVADLVLDELRQEAEHVDHAFYHLDGPGAIKHLDALLGLAALDGIQWVPGAGASPDPLDWIDLFRRIQAAGKKLLIYCPPDRIRPLLGRISRQGVCLSVPCPDQDTAEAVLRTLERIGA
jgi:hypothetical protein